MYCTSLYYIVDFFFPEWVFRTIEERIKGVVHLKKKV